MIASQEFSEIKLKGEIDSLIIDERRYSQIKISNSWYNLSLYGAPITDFISKGDSVFKDAKTLRLLIVKPDGTTKNFQSDFWEEKIGLK